MVLRVVGSSPISHPNTFFPTEGVFFMHSVYILYSASLDAFYKGQTNDVGARLARHNSRLERSTAPGVPWTLLWTAEKASRAGAMELERKLKNLSRVRLVAFMLKHKEGIVGPDALALLSQWSGC